MATFQLKTEKNRVTSFKIRKVPTKPKQFEMTVRVGVVTLMKTKAGVIHGCSGTYSQWGNHTFSIYQSMGYAWSYDLVKALSLLGLLSEQDGNYAIDQGELLEGKRQAFYRAKGILHDSKDLGIALNKTQSKKLENIVAEWRGCRG